MDKEIIDKVMLLAKQASKYFDFEKVYIYGSYSNKTNNSNSDIDVAFFVNEIKANHWELSARLFQLVDEIDTRIEPVIINEKTDASGFAKTILESGYLVA